MIFHWLKKRRDRKDRERILFSTRNFLEACGLTQEQIEKEMVVRASLGTSSLRFIEAVCDGYMWGNERLVNECMLARALQTQSSDAWMEARREDESKIAQQIFNRIIENRESAA